MWEPWGHEACLFRAARQCMVDSFLGNGNVTMQQLCAAEFWFHPTEPCQEAGNPMPAAKNKTIWNFSLLLAKDWWREHAGLTNLADLFPPFPSDKVAHMRQIPCISGREIMNSFPCRMSFCLVRWKFRKTCPWWRAWGKECEDKVAEIMLLVFGKIDLQLRPVPPWTPVPAQQQIVVLACKLLL